MNDPARNGAVQAGLRRSPLKRKTPLQSHSRLAPESAKRKKERPDRNRVRVETARRVGGRCEARLIVPEVECWGGFDVDERKSRGVNPGGHLDDSNTQLLCRGHHEWRGANPAEAHKRGLRVKSWE